MCGICLSVFYSNPSIKKEAFDEESFEDISRKLKSRGPDDFQKLNISFKDALDLVFISSVLHLRGSLLESQPYQDEKGNLLLWNGEIFDGLLIPASQSDTKYLSNKLFCSVKMEDVLKVFELIHGPYSFIFYQECGLLWFGRDVFGRRSLLWNLDDSSFKLCSVAYGYIKWQEVPTTGLFCLDLNETQLKRSFVIYHFPWSTSASGKNVLHVEHDGIHSELFLRTKVNHFLKTPISKPLNTLLPNSDDVSCNYMKLLSDNFDHATFLSLLEDITLQKIVDDFEKVLSDAVKKRVQNQLFLCKNCYLLPTCKTTLNCNHAFIGILFSGGLDSIVIAALAHKYLPETVPVDLLNVAFASNSKLDGSKCLKSSAAFDTPDRITGKNGVSALNSVCSSRVWNFIEINISEDELVTQRNNKISPLLKPSCTVLDDSIGCAIWFASHGEGSSIIEGNHIDYKSPARVLLVGMGADEQLGGYSRHRAQYNKFGWSGLIEEVSEQLDRIGSRNLGRDDRIISDNSVESRYPFLDENVVSFLNELPIWLKMNLNLPRGYGEKLLLRLLAYKIGLKEAAVLPKRAIQFGSRIARIENYKEKGSDICERLMNS